MQHIDLERMELDDLWMPHIELAEILAVRISSEKERLDARLHQLKTGRPAPQAPVERRRTRQWSRNFGIHWSLRKPGPVAAKRRNG